MITLVGGQKGGSGKSTLATNLAAALANQGKDVLLVDGNAAQGTASNWAARREDTGLKKISCIEKSGNLYKSLLDLKDRYDEVIVDTGGQDSKEFRTALLAADLFISPIRPSQADAETLIFVADLLEQAREMNPGLVAKLLITNAPSHPAVKLVEETKELVSDIEGFEVANSVIYYRKIYMDAIPAGAGVVEMDNAKARIEVINLIEELY